MQEEATALAGFADALAADAPSLEEPLSAARASFDAALAAAAHPMDAEEACEAFMRETRRLWLTRAGAIAAHAWRAPTAEETARMEAGRYDAYGYERDLKPESLEARMARFFPPAPAGWRVRHLVFSSGQAAMSNVMLALAGEQKLMAAHLGGYFETRALLGKLPALTPAADPARADLLIIEPVACDGRFRLHDVGAEAARLEAAGARPTAVVFDTTFLGLDDDMAANLSALCPLQPEAVARVVSGLKLFEAGFELSNVGLVSLFTRVTDDDRLPRRLEALRTLTGASLPVISEVALSAPWFLDRAATRRHAEAVFAHNRRLAEAVARANPRFAEASHPSLLQPDADAPYCAFRLQTKDPAAYDGLETRIKEEAQRRRIRFEKGGSFGFRGHRYEAVKPEDGEPFLRVAMGARGGWSCEGVIDLMAGIAA